MASVITIAGEQLFAAKAQANEQLDIDTFIFANVPNQDPNAPINREEGIPTAHIVYQQNVQQVGRINDNVVVYSTVLDSITGPFEFNWVGLYSSVNQKLVAINHVPTVTKTATAPGAAGNTLNRNFGIEYSGIAELTGISVEPETWQLDFTARLSGMDKLTQQLATDMNGKDWFIEDGLKVVPRATANSFSVTPGVGYVSGLRVELKQEHILIVQSYPQFVYVDAWFSGNANSTWSPQLAFTVTNTEMDDYIDPSGTQHYLCKISKIESDEKIIDVRDVAVSTKDLSFKYKQSLLGEFVELLDFVPNDIARRVYEDDKTLDMKAYIDEALSKYKHIGFPDKLIYSSGDHDITKRKISGKSPETSIIKLLGTNSAGIMFRNGVESIQDLGDWGGGLDWSINDLWIQGNWDGFSDLEDVMVERINGVTMESSGLYNTRIGLLENEYNFENNLGLIKSINGVRNNLSNCRISLSYEHGIMLYRGGYSLFSNNLIFNNRGQGLWITADHPDSGVTSFNIVANKIENNKGWFGNIRMNYYYGCDYNGNLTEAGNFGLYLEEGAELNILGGYSESNATADVHISDSAWNLNIMNCAWHTPPIIPESRGHYIYSKQSGLNYQPSLETENYFAGMTFGVDKKFGINTTRRIRAFTVREPLIAPSQGPFSQYVGIRIAGSANDDSDGATTEVLTEGNASDSNKSRMVFGVNDGTGIKYRTRVTEEGHYHTEGSWDGSHYMLGNAHLWIDSDNNLRLKASKPNSETDGKIIG